MKDALRLVRGFVAMAMLMVIGLQAAPANAGALGNNQGGGAFSPGWLFILEFPTGNRNAVALLNFQAGQLAGLAFISGKPCLFNASGTYTGTEESGTLSMTWTGRKNCPGEILSLEGSVLNGDVTGTFTDTTVAGGPFDFVGSAIDDQNNQH